MKTFNVTTFAIDADKLALVEDFNRIVAAECFYSAVAGTGVSGNENTHALVSEDIARILKRAEDIPASAEFLTALRGMYFFISNYSLDELYEMPTEHEVKMKEEFEFDNPIPEGFNPQLRQIALSVKHLEVSPELSIATKITDTFGDKGVIVYDNEAESFARAKPTALGGELLPPGALKHTFYVDAELEQMAADREMNELVDQEPVGRKEDGGNSMPQMLRRINARRQEIKRNLASSCDVKMSLFIQGITERRLPGGTLIRGFSSTTVSPRVVHWLEGDTIMVGGDIYYQATVSFQTDMGDVALERRINDYKGMLDKKDPSLRLYFESELKSHSKSDRYDETYPSYVARLAYGLLSGDIHPMNNM